MYDYFKGRITRLEPTCAVVECGGVGYSLKISPSTYERLKACETATIYVRLIVREDAHLLFGFETEAERAAFDRLLSVSGVGPNTALTVLSALSPPELYRAVEAEDVAALRQIRGVGAKTAARIVLELKGQLPQSVKADAAETVAVRNEALAALAVLGFPKSSMEKKVDDILAAGIKTVEEVVRLALRN
ncbi:MAG: Holliday junction branch migration protein RuvA [Bacteroidia bacterium]|nr:Holliday junction branch migration protein RuvA [Bacteroidia bacterium]